MSSLASSVEIAVRWVNVSPLIGCNRDSVATLWQTSVSNEAVTSRSSLCLIVGKPPVGHIPWRDQQKKLCHMYIWQGCLVVSIHLVVEQTTMKMHLSPWLSQHIFSSVEGDGRTQCWHAPFDVNIVLLILCRQQEEMLAS